MLFFVGWKNNMFFNQPFPPSPPESSAGSTPDSGPSSPPSVAHPISQSSSGSTVQEVREKSFNYISKFIVIIFFSHTFFMSLKISNFKWWSWDTAVVKLPGKPFFLISLKFPISNMVLGHGGQIDILECSTSPVSSGWTQHPFQRCLFAHFFNTKTVSIFARGHKTDFISWVVLNQGKWIT